MVASTFIKQKTSHWIERFGYLAEGPAFGEAIRALVEFLAEELGEHDWPLAVLCRDGERNWAFAVLAFDTTSYIHAAEVGSPYVEWLGTTWEPGCECGEALEDGSDEIGGDDEHRADCPARGDS